MTWVSAWSRAKLSGTQERVMLCLCRWMTREGGKWVSFCPRSQMAETLGVSEQTVSNAIATLKQRGFLAIAESGHRGRVSRYVLMPAERQMGYSGEVTNCQANAKIAYPQAVTKAEPRSKKGYSHSTEKVTRTASPTRDREEIRAEHPSPSHPSRRRGAGDWIDECMSKTWRT